MQRNHIYLQSWVFYQATVAFLIISSSLVVLLKKLNSKGWSLERYRILNWNKTRKIQIDRAIFLFLCRTIHEIYFLKITPFKCWPQLRFNSFNRKHQFWMTRSRTSVGISLITSVMLASNASIVAGLSTKHLGFTYPHK